MRKEIVLEWRRKEDRRSIGILEEMPMQYGMWKVLNIVA